MSDTHEDTRQNAGNEHPDRRHREPPPDLLERMVSWVSMAFVLTLAGFLVWEAFQQTAPAVIDARAGAAWQGETIYYLPLKVSNRGGRSVQNLRMRIRLMDGQRVVATSEATLSWLPARSTRRVVTAFERDPRRLDVEIVPAGYELP